MSIEKLVPAKKQTTEAIPILRMGPMLVSQVTGIAPSLGPFVISFDYGKSWYGLEAYPVKEEIAEIAMESHVRKTDYWY